MKKLITLFIIAIAANLMLGSNAFGQLISARTSTSASTTSGTLTIAKPGGLAVGDVMFANIVQGDDNESEVLGNATRTGWTIVRGGQFGDNGGNSWWGTLLYKIADATDVAAADFAFTMNANTNSATGGIAAFFNVDIRGGVSHTGSGVGPFDVAPGTFQVTGGVSGNPVVAPSITTATNNAAVVMFAMAGDDNTFGSWLTTAPGSLTLTQVLTVASGNNPDKAAGAAWSLKATAGITGDGNTTMSGSDRNGGVLIALKPMSGQVAALVPFATIASQSIPAGGTVNFTAMALNFPGSGNYSYQWTAAGATIPVPNPASLAAASNAKTLTFPTAGTFTVSVTISRTGATTTVTNSIIVNVYGAPAIPNLWAINGTGSNTVSTFEVNQGFDFGPGPTPLFTMSMGAPSAALALSDKPTPLSGYFYWLANTTGNNGVVNVYGSNNTGGSQTLIGSIDLTPDNTSLGFVRLGMRGDGRAFLLASGGGNLYLASFKPNGVTLNGSLPAADQLAVVDNSVSLVGGSVATFQNGDLCFAGDGNLVALANSGGTTQIFTGTPNGSSTTLTKKFDVLDQNGAAFSGSVNGIAFDDLGSLYVSASVGLYFINKNTVDGPAATININQVWAGTGLTDLASNFFPFTIVTPVSLTDFTVTRQGGNAQVSWRTVTEMNTDHFVIERSKDGINFVEAGSTAAAGNSTGAINYQYLDPIAGMSGIIYYRLKTVDMDASVSYSKIISLRLDGSGIVKNFNVFPNPFTSDIKIELNAEKDANVTIRISNAAGQSVFSRSNLVQKGNNIIVLNSELSTLKAGMYIVEVISEEGRQTQKIIKR